MTLFQRFVTATGIVACVLLVPLAAQCQTALTIPEAVAAANNWLHLGKDMNWGWQAATDFAPGSAREIFQKGELVGYFVPVSTGGYVVLPAYRELPPITAYSAESNFDPNAEGGFCALVSEGLSAKLNVVRTFLNLPAPTAEWLPVQKEIERDRLAWQSYTGSYAEFSQALVAQNSDLEPSQNHRDHAHSVDDLGPLVTTSWHQNPPFNNFCPMGDGARTAVGCVATACAQILAYWRYPVTGTGSHSDVWNGDQSCGGNTTGATLTATYSDPYDWANILDHYTGTEPQAQKDAVAELCYEIGVALNMDYGVCGSGANTASVASILPQYFGYAGGIEIRYRADYATATDWFAMLKEDLNQSEPMQYRISSHSIVCDGWRVSGTDQIHLNYGWNDSHTAWYTVDNLYCTWAGCSPNAEYVVRHIRPVGAPPADLTITHPNGGETLDIGDTLRVAWTSQSVSGDVRIELNRSYPSGVWETLSADAPNTGSYVWTVTSPACTAARARISSLVNPSVSDTSDANFSAIVLASPQVVAYQVGDGIRLDWNSTGAAHYKIFASDSACGAFSTLVASTSDTTYTDDTAADLRFYTVVSSTTP